MAGSVPAVAERRDSPGAGVALHQLAIMLFVSMDVMMKLIVPGMPVLQLMAGRFAAHTLAVAVLCRWLGRPVLARPRRPAIQAARSLLLLVGSVCFTLALRDVPVADVTAVNFLSPLLLTLLAAWTLGERVGWHRWSAVAAGFAGMLIIIRPGMGATHPALLYPLVTACTFAVYQLLTRRLAGQDDPLTTILHTGIAATLVLLPALPLVWQEVPALLWLATGLIGVLSALSHYLLILAYGRAQASLLAPFTYTQLGWAVVGGVLVFGDLPDPPTVVGATIIAGAGLAVLWREQRLRGGVAPTAGRP